MPIPDEYAYTVHEIGTDKRISFEAKFDAYIAEHGVERAKGYLDGLTELYNVVLRLGYRPNQIMPNSEGKTARLVRDFESSNDHMLQNCKAKLDQHNQLKPPAP